MDKNHHKKTRVFTLLSLFREGDGGYFILRHSSFVKHALVTQL